MFELQGNMGYKVILDSEFAKSYPMYESMPIMIYPVIFDVTHYIRRSMNLY